MIFIFFNKDLFTKIPGVWSTGTGFAGYLWDTTAEKCAELCLSKEKCLSFDWNFSTGSKLT